VTIDNTGNSRKRSQSAPCAQHLKMSDRALARRFVQIGHEWAAAAYEQAVRKERARIIRTDIGGHHDK
jgi:hypothetical protein